MAPEGTVTEAGTETVVLLLVSDTSKPPLPAAVESVTVQLVLVGPTTDELPQVSPLSDVDVTVVGGGLSVIR